MQVALNPQYDTINTSAKNLHAQIKAQFTKFLQSFKSEKGTMKYMQKAKTILQEDSRNKLVIATSDFFKFNSEIAEIVLNEYSRYQSVLNDALTEFMQQIEKSFGTGTSVKTQQNDQSQQGGQLQTFEVAFDKGIVADSFQQSVRNLKCQMLGKLRSIVGTVTRVSEVRPQLLVGVFVCQFCGRMSDKIPQQYKYTTPKKCLGQNCGNNAFWQLNNRHSTFADFQKVRVQQDASKIPPGSMPRSIDVILRNQDIEKGQPGDQIHVIGYLAVIPDVQSLLKPGQRTAVFTRNTNTRKQLNQQGINGIKGIKQLSYKLCFIGNNIFVMNNQFNEDVLTEQQASQMQVGMEDGYNEEQIMRRLFSKLNQSEILQIKRIKEHPRVYENLAESLFHEIFGHVEIKKALLLQLLGGIHKKTQTKISLRGDINILIVGDPSTAKSQFLKCINKFVPRSVYTNGKTTTAAGLTASVVRDQESGNVSIEAGALLLADNGICCIDEFDKMEIKDQVAIHEAMEQQTISIAKAGIQATLHARTSILAAANPLFGRYDKSQSLRKNINISPPIMSRFDLYFIICDEINEESDKNLSQFIVSMHQQRKQVKIEKPYTIRQVKNYLSIARKLKPRMSKEAAKCLRQRYVQLRRNDKQIQNSQYQMTVRQLQSMIRLSQALAKLHLDVQVKQEYVREAHRLLSCAVVKLQKATCQLVDQQVMSNNQKASLGLRQLLVKKQVQKKQRTITISHETFQQIKNDIFRLFNQKQKLHKKDRIEDVELYLTQEDVTAYLIAINYENGDLSSEDFNQKTKRLYHSIINKLIKEKILVVIQENNQNIYDRMLCLHPNVESVHKIKQEIKREEDAATQRANDI